MLLTRSPLYSLPEGNFPARLACVRHAASVRSEPGSNSPVKIDRGEGSAPSPSMHDRVNCRARKRSSHAYQISGLPRISDTAYTYSLDFKDRRHERREARLRAIWESLA